MQKNRYHHIESRIWRVH